MRVPPEADTVRQMAERELVGSLVAVYLYGSAVSGGLRPDSDVDLLIVIDETISSEIRRRLLAELMVVSGRVGDPSRRPIELTIVQLSECSAPRYPARYEFLYGEWLRDDFEAGAIPEPACDPDMTLLLAQARWEALPLLGPAPGELLAEIPQSDIRRAIDGELPDLLDSLDGDERNVLLTLARMWHTLETGKFVPKDVAAEWAISRLPAAEAALLAQARDGYIGKEQDNWRARTGEAVTAAELLRQAVISAL
jgi:predicted nucleotidyltransferase